MKPIRWIKQNTNINFLGFRKISIFFSFLLCISSILSIFIFSLNYGIDFKGGTLIELRAENSITTIGEIRESFLKMNLGDVAVKKFGKENDYLVKIEITKSDDENFIN